MTAKNNDWIQAEYQLAPEHLKLWEELNKGRTANTEHLAETPASQNLELSVGNDCSRTIIPKQKYIRANFPYEGDLYDA